MSPKLDHHFDAAAVPEDENDFELLPEGWYRVAATKSEHKPNSKGTGTFLQFEFTVLEGTAKGRKLWHRFTWTHDTSEKAVEIGHRQLADLCEAVSRASLDATEELHGEPFDAHVGTEAGTGQYKDKNIVKSFRAPSSATQNPFPPAEAHAAADAAEDGWA